MDDGYAITHQLKIEDRFLNRILSGQKRFEIRKNDRDFQVNDWMRLQSIDKSRSVACKIIYISHFEQKEGYCVIGFTVGEEKDDV